MLAFAVSMGFLNWEFVQSNTSFLQVSGSCSRHIFQDVDPHLSPVSGREKGLSKRCRRLGPFLMWQDAFQDRSPGSLLEPNARASFESTFDIPFQHRKLNYTIHFKGAPSKCSSSASYIYTSTFEFQTQDSRSSSDQPRGSSPLLDEVFHFTFLWTRWRKCTEILNASWVYLKQR